MKEPRQFTEEQVNYLVPEKEEVFGPGKTVLETQVTLFNLLLCARLDLDESRQAWNGLKDVQHQTHLDWLKVTQDLEQARKDRDEAIAQLSRLFTEQRPGYHDCLDNGLPECEWCLTEKFLSRIEQSKKEQEHG